LNFLVVDAVLRNWSQAAKFSVFGHDQGILSLAAASSGLTDQKNQ
jgi:hypothetical protein